LIEIVNFLILEEIEMLCTNCLKKVKDPEEKICLRDEKGRFTKEKKPLWWARKKRPGSQHPTEVFCWHCMLEEDEKLVKKYGNQDRYFVPLERSLKRDEVKDEEYLLKAQLYQKKVSKEPHRVCHVCGHKHGQIVQKEGHKPYVALVGAVTSDSAKTMRNLIKEIARDKEIRYTCRDCIQKTARQDKTNFSADAVDDILYGKRMLYSVEVIMPAEKKDEGKLTNDSLQKELKKVAQNKQKEVETERKKKKPHLEILKATGTNGRQ